MSKIVRVVPLPGYRLQIEFQDGVTGTVDLSAELHGEMFEPLRDETVFQQVSIDEYGAVTWPNGADLAPDALYAEFTAGRAKERSDALIAAGTASGS